MDVYVNGVPYRTKTGVLEVKRRFGAAAVLVSSEQQRPLIAPVDAVGRFLVRDGSRYDVFALQKGDARVMASLALQHDLKTSQREVRFSQRELRESQSQGLKRGRSSSGSKGSRQKGNYVLFVQAFMKSFTNVSFADAAKEWRLFPEDDKRTAPVDHLVESVRAKGLYQASLV
ncbi:hypothetical protein DQ04_00081230 [Trypanosoma grayi]|uniref:hypothetical protein n=1 Tax=Trypanosoma grayi TaxID=71804 RepID=UPI0004F42B85|nr:hypothetical protein DQ04_00081230 [Trypanosoma grayi]KEG15424.1 hypothetical protein DQ04_00081230 [Trypanosoma grayi]